MVRIKVLVMMKMRVVMLGEESDDGEEKVFSLFSDGEENSGVMMKGWGGEW